MNPNETLQQFKDSISSHTKVKIVEKKSLGIYEITLEHKVTGLTNKSVVRVEDLKINAVTVKSLIDEWIAMCVNYCETHIKNNPEKLAGMLNKYKF